MTDDGARMTEDSMRMTMTAQDRQKTLIRLRSF